MERIAQEAAAEPLKAVAYMRTSSATNVGADKDSERRQRTAALAARDQRQACGARFRHEKTGRTVRGRASVEDVGRVGQPMSYSARAWRFVVSIIISCETIYPAAAQQPTHQPPTATEVFNLRSRCADLGEQILEATGRDIANTLSQISH